MKRSRDDSEDYKNEAQAKGAAAVDVAVPSHCLDHSSLTEPIKDALGDEAPATRRAASSTNSIRISRATLPTFCCTLWANGG